MNYLRQWHRRWKLRRIILALQEATEHKGLKPETVAFCRAMEATYDMAADLRKNEQLILSVTKHELAVFLSYMIGLHDSKLSLLTRARIGLVTLLVSDKKLMPREQDPMEFAQEQFGSAKSSKSEKRIQRVSPIIKAR